MITTYENGKKIRSATVTDTEILGFFGPYRFLSNFELCEIPMDDGNIYPSSENAYMAYKTLDLELRKPFTNYSPQIARKEGQLLKLRENWEQIRYNVMKNVLKVKFEIPELKEKLLATGNKELVESNDWNDTYWGVCNGVGASMLGKILMEIRDQK